MNLGKLKGKRVWVTGAYGFIGRQLVDQLFSVEEAEVFALQFDNDLSSRHAWDIRGKTFGSIWWNQVQTLTCDLTNPRSVERAVAIAQPDVVFHLAAISQVPEAHYMPSHTYETNVMGLVNLLEAVRRYRWGVPVIIASSDKAYGDWQPDEGGLKEWMPSIPGHPYDTSKACADLVAMSFAKHYHMSITVARMANIFGRGDTNWKRIIPGVCRWVARGEDIIIRSDGKSRREYIGVDAAVWAYLTLAEKLMDKTIASGEMFNFGGIAATPIQLTEAIIKIAGKDNNGSKIIVQDGAQTESNSIVLNDDKAALRLGWRYDDDDFVKDLRETVQWYLQYVEEMK